MIKKYYTFIIASESDHINKSFKLLRTTLITTLIIIIFFFTIFCLFACYGISVYFYPTSKDEEFSYLKKFKSEMHDVVFNSSNESSDSLVLDQIRGIIINNGPSITMIAPVDGYITQAIDSSKNHNGVDIISKRGDYIKTVEDGIVLFSGIKGELGNTLLISHPYNYFTLYGHCDSIFVNEKDIVRKGDVIAILGNSGVTTAPHLHFEIWKDNIAIDPRTIIKIYGERDVSKK